MNLLLPLLSSASLGILVLMVLLKDCHIRHRNLFFLSLGPALGLSLISLILFWSLIITSTHAKTLTLFLVFTSIICLVACLLKRSTQRSSMKRPSLAERYQAWIQDTSLQHKGIFIFSLLIFLFFLVYYLCYFFSTNALNMFGGWDARYFWSLKAKFLFADTSAWKSMFHPALNWSHTDYPLLLPASIAWGWHALGTEAVAWPPLVSLLFSLSLILMVVWYLASYVNWHSAFLAGAFLLHLEPNRFWSAAQYADIPLCFLMTTSALMLVIALKTKQIPYLFLAGLLTGLSSWTKNEGLFFLIWITGLLFLYLLPLLKSETKKAIRSLGAFALGVALPLLSVCFVKFILDSSGNEFISMNRNPIHISALLTDGSRVKTLLTAFVAFMTRFSVWSVLWPIFGLAFVFSLKSLRKAPFFLLVYLILLIEVGYFAVLLITPHDFVIQIKTSLNRLLMHPSALALVFSVHVFESLASRSQTQKNADNKLTSNSMGSL